MVAISDSWQAELYHSEALQSGNAACEILEHGCSNFREQVIRMDLNVRVDVYFVRVNVNYDLIPLQIFFILIFLNNKFPLVIHAKFQPNIPSRSGEKVYFIGVAIFSTGSHLGFSTRVNFLILKPFSLIMPHLKFDNHGRSGFNE